MLNFGSSSIIFLLRAFPTFQNVCLASESVAAFQDLRSACTFKILWTAASAFEVHIFALLHRTILRARVLDRQVMKHFLNAGTTFQEKIG